VRGGLVGLALSAAVLVGACSSSQLTATGVVIQVTGTSPSAISSFLLHTADNQVLTFMVGPVTFDQKSFPPEHLREHQALASPVVVTYEVQDGKNVALKLADAPGVPRPTQQDT
jgi:hypothetical protein